MNLRREWQLLVATARSLDRQTVFVLTATMVFVVLHAKLGSRRFFRTELAFLFAEEWRGLLEWGWRFGMQGVTGFVLPALCLVLLFRRRLAEIGLGLGDWKLAGFLLSLYVPLVTLGTWVISDSAAFQAAYPHYRPAAANWNYFLIYQALFVFYWIGWEYLWRGFVLFGTAHTFGLYAIFVQAVPFAVRHLQKPLPEALMSIGGAIVLGALVWRCRSFWIAVPIHAAQMFILDFWCSVRIRTGVSGVGPGALFELLKAWLNG